MHIEEHRGQETPMRPNHKPHSATDFYALPPPSKFAARAICVVLEYQGTYPYFGKHHDFTFTFHFRALEKEMATHSSVLAWRIPETGEPGGPPSMGQQCRTRLTQLSSSSSSHFLLHVIFPIKGSNPQLLYLPHCR